MRSLLICVLFVACLCSAPAYAQQKEKKPASPPASKPHKQPATPQAPATPAPQPAHEIQKLAKALTGRWSIREKFEPDERMPDGGVGQGTEVWRPGPGGYTLIEEFHSQDPDREVFGLSLTWWDASTHQYKTLWCANGNPAGCDTGLALRWEDNQIVVTTDFERAGKKFSMREVLSQITPNSFTQTLDIGESGGELKRSVTIHATKIK